MKIIIAGSRDFNDYEMLREKSSHLIQNLESVEIVSGTANGADKLGERFAKEFSLPLKQFPAKWSEYGKSAGYKRNEEMAQYADALIAFWNGNSKGTKHMIDLAEKYNLKIRIIKY